MLSDRNRQVQNLIGPIGGAWAWHRDGWLRADVYNRSIDKNWGVFLVLLSKKALRRESNQQDGNRGNLFDFSIELIGQESTSVLQQLVICLESSPHGPLGRESRHMVSESTRTGESLAKS